MEELNLNKIQKEIEPVDVEQGFVGKSFNPDNIVSKKDVQPIIEEPPRDDKVVSLEELQDMGLGKDITPFYRNQMQPALLNLHPKYQTFFDPERKDFQRMLQGEIPVGYKDGIIPLSINDLGLTSMEDKLSKIYAIQNGKDETIEIAENREASGNLFQTEGVRYAFKNGKAYKLDVSKQKELNTFQTLFGDFLPIVTGPDDLKQRALYEAQLAELGLDPDKAKDLQDQLKESHYYVGANGKIQYHEETKDLSYLIPTEGDASFFQQFTQIMGRITSDFPSVITGLGVAGIKQYNYKHGGKPDDKLLSPYVYANGIETDTFKSNQQILEDSQLYIEQEENYTAKIIGITEMFDTMQNTNTLFMSHKKLYKALVENNTSFVMDDKLLEELAVQNPDQSILFHIADTSAEAIPYVATLNGILGTFKLGGTKIADDALQYSLKNSGPGLKYANPIEALNAFFQKEAFTKVYGKNSTNKFIKKVQRRFETQLLTKAGKEKLQINLLDEINSIDEQIKKAIKKGDNNLVERLLLGKETLVAKQAGLQVKHFTTFEKSLFRNEIFAATFGGVGDYFFQINSGPAIAMELSGAFFEPRILKKRGFNGVFQSALTHAASALNAANMLSFNSKFVDDLSTMSKSAYLNVNFDDLKILGDDGLERIPTLKETKALRAFTDLLINLPPKRRAEVIGRMQELNKQFDKLTLGMSGEDAAEVKLMFGQFTGLAALQAVDEMYMVKVAAGNLTSDMLVQGNDYINSTKVVLREIQANLEKFMQKPALNPNFTEFAEKINIVVKESQESIAQRELELLEVFDVVENYVRTGNMFDGTDTHNLNMMNFFDELQYLSKNGTTPEIQKKAIEKVKELDTKILTHFDNIGKGLNADGSNYNSNWFSGMVDGLYTYYKLGAREKYLNLFSNNPNVRVDFTKFFDEIVEKQGGVERLNRGTKNQNPIGAYTGNFPSSYETNNLINIIEMSAKRNIIEFISDKNNRAQLIKFFDDPSEVIPGLSQETFVINEELLSILRMNLDLSPPNAEKVFNAMKENLKATYPNYKNKRITEILALDVRDALGGDIPLMLNLQEAMEFKSGVGAMNKAMAGEPKGNIYANMFTEIDNSLLTSISKENNIQLSKDYADAVNTYADFYNRFNNFATLRGWTTYNGQGSKIDVKQDASGNATSELERVQAINREGTKIVNEISGADDIKVPSYVHAESPYDWIDWGKIMSNETEALKFKNEVILPLVGDRDFSTATGYFIDFNNPVTVQKLKIVSKFLQEEFAAHLRRSDAGKLYMNKKEIEQVLLVNPPKKTDAKEIKIFNGFDEVMSVGTGENKISLVDINGLINMNLGIDMVIARNATINNIARTDTVQFAKDLKKIKKTLQKRLKDFKFNQRFFSDDSVILQFGDGLTNPSTFNDAVITTGSIDNLEKLRTSIVGSKKLTNEQFNEVVRNLVSKHFFDKFAVVADDVKASVKNKDMVQVSELYTFQTAEARKYLKENKVVLEKVFGKEHYDNIVDILGVQALLTGADASRINITPISNSLSLNSLLARGFAISRGVISPRYVAMEVAIRRFAKNKGVLIRTVLENPNMADVVLKILETENIYQDPKMVETFYNLLRESTFKAIVLREGSEKGLDYQEESEDKFLTNMNTSLSQLIN